MKLKFALIIISLLIACSSKGQESAEKYTEISIDELISQSDKYENKKVEIIGLVDHMCGVDGKKIKLKSTSGKVLKIVPNDNNKSFDSSFKKQIVSVRGIVDIKHLSKAYVDEMEKKGTLLCHIDHSACKDKAWVNNKIDTGKDVEIVKKDIAKLRNQMKVSGNEFVTYICIRADKIEVL